MDKKRKTVTEVQIGRCMRCGHFLEGGVGVMCKDCDEEVQREEFNFGAA